MSNIIKLPVIMVAIFMVLMLALDFSGLGHEVELPAYTVVSVAIFILGLLVIAIGGYTFRKVRTTVNPMTPEQSTRLVTTGIYSYSRNPMYIGFLAWLIAFVIFLGNLINILLLPFYILLVNRLYILPEEKALEKIFGNKFRSYKNRVRRWL